MKKKIELPKLPYGQGTFSWDNDDHTRIRFTRTYTSDYDGSTHRLIVRGDTVQECYALMKKRERQKELEISGEALESAESDIAFLGSAMLDWLKQTKFNKQKATAYDRNERTIIKQIKEYPFGMMQVCCVKSRDITNHLNYLQFEKHYSYSTVKKVYEILKQYFAFFYVNDMNANPMNRVTPPKKPSEIGELTLEDLTDDAPMEDVVLSDAEIETLRKFVFQEPKNGSVGRSKYGVAIYFILITCLRVGEAVTVTWGDIDFEKKTMLINKTTSRIVDRNGRSDKKTKLIITRPKTANAIRTIMLSDNAIEALNIIKSRSDFTAGKDFVLSASTGERVTGVYLLRILKGVLKGAKLDTPARDKVFGVHYLRHSGISYYLRNGIPIELVSKMAGHSSVQITYNTYYHVIKDQNMQMLDMMNNI